MEQELQGNQAHAVLQGDPLQRSPSIEDAAAELDTLKYSYASAEMMPEAGNGASPGEAEGSVHGGYARHSRGRWLTHHQEQVRPHFALPQLTHYLPIR